jgi:tRNA pseudouridine13 synthase
MPGRKVRPLPVGAPAALEESMLAATGVTAEHLARSGDAEGTRRALRLPVAIDVRADDEGLVLAFDLPAGSYATMVLREITKGALPDGADA